MLRSAPPACLCHNESSGVCVPERFAAAVCPLVTGVVEFYTLLTLFCNFLRKDFADKEDVCGSLLICSSTTSCVLQIRSPDCRSCDCMILLPQQQNQLYGHVLQLQAAALVYRDVSCATTSGSSHWSPAGSGSAV